MKFGNGEQGLGSDAEVRTACGVEAGWRQSRKSAPVGCSFAPLMALAIALAMDVSVGYTQA